MYYEHMFVYLRVHLLIDYNSSGEKENETSFDSDFYMRSLFLYA